GGGRRGGGVGGGGGGGWWGGRGPPAPAIGAGRSRAVSSVALRAASPASGTSSATRASSSSCRETVSVSSIVWIDSERFRPIPSFGVLWTKIPPPGPRVARSRGELATRRSPHRR